MSLIQRKRDDSTTWSTYAGVWGHGGEIRGDLGDVSNQLVQASELSSGGSSADDCGKDRGGETHIDFWFMRRTEGWYRYAVEE